MAFSDYASTTSVRPDRPLVVKCTFDQRMKRITFASSRNCSYDLLKAKVEQCFALSATPFTVRYKDDDGEVTDVTSDGDLTEAIHYFNVGDDPPISSASSVMSGRSASSRRVTLRLTVAVDYELSLSDTASEYSGPNASDLTLSREPLNGYIQEGYLQSLELEDDAVTVSSRDTASISRGTSALQINSRPPLRPLSPVLSDDSPPASSLGYTGLSPDNENITDSPTQKGKSKLSLRSDPAGEQGYVLSHDFQQRTAVEEVAEEPPVSPDDDSGVFDRLKRLEGAELGDSYESQEVKRLSQTERGAQWLRDQNVRAIQSMFGALPEPSVSDDADSLMLEGSPEEDLIGDLALQQDPSGKYYYTYTSSSGASQAQDEASDWLQDGASIVDSVINGNEGNRNGEPSPHGLAWLADQQQAQASSSSVALAPNPFSDTSPAHIRERFQIHPDIPPEVLKFIPEYRLPLLPPEEITHCASCGITLESFRYVCTTCGEQEPHSRHSPPASCGKGKGKDASPSGNNNPFSYPPQNRTAPPSPSSSSWTLLSTSNLPPRTSSLGATLGKPTLTVPRRLAPSSSQDTLFVPPSGHLPGSAIAGYELCSSCIESAGVLHALEAGAGTSPHSNSPLSSPEENMRALSQLRRSAPRSKGHIRHAYSEKVWGPEGWKDVEQDDISNCSICNASLATQRYKCASCTKFDLCRACYSQVHEIHPSHAFLSVPDQSKCTRCEPEHDASAPSLENGESSMKHPGVKCHHCMLDIVGARFHCAVCDAVDICSNCESAGLPGNLTSPDGGHDSSHIMIKIPYPLESNEVETASRRAISLWHGRDRPELQRPRGRRQRSSSQDSAHARTVVGSRAVNGGPHSRHGSSHNEGDHHLPCRFCGVSIVGTRYQCATCPSSPTSYNLCAKCEIQSYVVHDARHIFIKFPRAVDQPIQCPSPLLPVTMYSAPAGFVGGRWTQLEPQAYIQSLYHRTAVCDRCIETIQGVWLHCAYCGSDLCEECEGLGGHDNTHVFLVFKSMVNMDRLGEICNIENPARSPPIIPHPVYLPS